MKTKILIFLTLLPGIMLAQNTLDWSSVILIGGSGYGNMRPRITVPGDNLPVIIFGNPDSAAIYEVKSTGTSFTSPQRITSNDVNAVTATWQGPEIASNGNSVFMTFKCSPEDAFPIYTVKSSDAGLTFQNKVEVENIGNDISRFPCIDVLPDGNPVVAFMRFDSVFNNPRYVVVNSVDGGQSYLNDVIASTNIFAGEPCDCCPANINANSNVQVMSYRNNDNNVRDIKAAFSFDNGNNFTTGNAVDNTNWIINQCPSTGPDAVISGDSIIVVWKSGSTSQRVWVSSSNINNAIMGTYGVINNNSTIQNYPRIAGNGDTLGVVWEEKNGGQTYIQFTYSITGANGLFQNPITISTSMQNQTKPDIAFSNGTFHIVWSDGINNKCLYRKATIPSVSNIIKNEVKNVDIFPSPFFNSLTITSDVEIVSAVLTDIAGKIVFTKNCERNKVLEFNMENIEPGIYVVIITDSHNKITARRIVKE